MRLRGRIITHCIKNNRTVIEEYKLILEKKSSMSRADRDYLVNEIHNKELPPYLRCKK